MKMEGLQVEAALLGYGGEGGGAPYPLPFVIFEP